MAPSPAGLLCATLHRLIRRRGSADWDRGPCSATVRTSAARAPIDSRARENLRSETARCGVQGLQGSNERERGPSYTLGGACSGPAAVTRTAVLPPLFLSALYPKTDRFPKTRPQRLEAPKRQARSVPNSTSQLISNSSLFLFFFNLREPGVTNVQLRDQRVGRVNLVQPKIKFQINT